MKTAKKSLPVHVAKKDAEARAKKAGVPLDYAGMKRAGVRVSQFIASRGLVYLRRRAPRTQRLEFSCVPFQKVGGVWTFVGGDSAWRPVGMGGR